MTRPFHDQLAHDVGSRLGMRASLLVAVGLITVSTSVRAEAPPRRKIQIEVQQGMVLPSCRVEERLRASLARRLGYDPVDETAGERLRVQVFRASPKENSVYLELSAPDGSISWQRLYDRFPANDCNKLVDSVTLGLQVAFNMAQRSPGPEPAPSAPEPCPPSRPCPPCAPCPSVPQPEEGTEEVSLSASIGAEVLFGPLPAVTGGGAVGLALRGPLVVVGLEGRISGPAATEVPPERELLAWLATGSVVPCLRAWAFDGCGVLSIGSLHALGRGVDVPAAGSRLYVAAGARLAAVVPLNERFRLRPYVELTFPMNNIKLTLEQSAVWMTPRVGAIVGVSAVMEFAPR